MNSPPLPSPPSPPPKSFLALALAYCSFLVLLSLPSESLVLPQFPWCSHPPGLLTGVYEDFPELSREEKIRLPERERSKGSRDTPCTVSKAPEERS